MKNLWQKFITSSIDPSKVSMTIKGILTAILPLVLLWTGITQTDYGQLTDGIVNIVFYGTSILSSIQIVYGILRKIDLGRWSSV